LTPSAFNYFGTTTEGNYVCGMDIINNASTEAIHIKYYTNKPTIFVQVFKTSWRIPQGTKMAAEIGFDKESWGSVDSAYGETFGEGKYRTGVVDIGIAQDSVDNFLENVAASDKMWIKFPDGNEAPWVADMTGSRNSVNAFKACINKIASSGQPTQPFSNGGPQLFSDGTQPFSKNAKPVDDAKKSRDQI
jgi:hypothetical protein